MPQQAGALSADRWLTLFEQLLRKGKSPQLSSKRHGEASTLWPVIAMGIQPAIHCTGPSSWTLRTPRPERFAILATSAFGMATLFAQTRKFFCGISRKVFTLGHYK